MINNHLISIGALRHHLVSAEHPPPFYPGGRRVFQLDIKKFIKRDRAPRAWGHRAMDLTLKNSKTFYSLQWHAVFCGDGPSQLHFIPCEFGL
jgi:hypothetical protein